MVHQPFEWSGRKSNVAVADDGKKFQVRGKLAENERREKECFQWSWLVDVEDIITRLGSLVPAYTQNHFRLFFPLAVFVFQWGSRSSSIQTSDN